MSIPTDHINLKNDREETLMLVTVDSPGSLSSNPVTYVPVYITGGVFVGYMKVYSVTGSMSAIDPADLEGDFLR
jgi:hypothetical protein